MSRPAVFLDRDGVLNEAFTSGGRPKPPGGLTDLRVLPGVAGACAQLAGAGYALVCVTNQPDIARGTADPVVVAAMNARLQTELGLEEVVVCPHDDADGCDCRKPLPGMLVNAAERLDLDLARSVMVGDRWRDIAAGQAAGTATVFIDRAYDEPAPENPDFTVRELKEATTWIIQRLA